MALNPSYFHWIKAGFDHTENYEMTSYIQILQPDLLYLTFTYKNVSDGQTDIVKYRVKIIVQGST